MNYVIEHAISYRTRGPVWVVIDEHDERKESWWIEFPLSCRDAAEAKAKELNDEVLCD